MFLFFLYLRVLVTILRLETLVQALPSPQLQAIALNTTDLTTEPHQQPTHFHDDFHFFNKDIWKCEFTCPTVIDDRAEFRLRPGIEPMMEGSWTKASYKGRRFTSGKFTVRFSLTARPKEKVWWGVALWDHGANPDKSEYNEINFGYTTDQSCNYLP
jgi:hypothetical protein